MSSFELVHGRHQPPSPNLRKVVPGTMAEGVVLSVSIPNRTVTFKVPTFADDLKFGPAPYPPCPAGTEPAAGDRCLVLWPTIGIETPWVLSWASSGVAGVEVANAIISTSAPAYGAEESIVLTGGGVWCVTTLTTGVMGLGAGGRIHGAVRNFSSRDIRVRDVEIGMSNVAGTQRRDYISSLALPPIIIASGATRNFTADELTDGVETVGADITRNAGGEFVTAAGGAFIAYMYVGLTVE